MSDIQELLTQYEDLAAALDILRMDHQAARQAVIPTEVQIELEAIDAEFADRFEIGTKRLEEIKEKLKTAGVAAGQTVNGQNFQVVYKRGGWKIKDLERLVMMAIKNPAIMECLEKSEPSVAVQVRRGGK